MADLQPLLPRRTPVPFPPIAAPPNIPPLGSLPPMAGSGLSSLSSLGAPPTPDVTLNPRISSISSDPLITRKDSLEADLYNRMNPIAPTPPDTLGGKIKHVIGEIGQGLGDIFVPDTMAMLDKNSPLYNERIMARDKSDLSGISNEQTAADQRKGIEATTAYTTARPGIEQAKILQKLTSTLAPKGIKATMNPDGTIDTEDDTDSQAYKDRVALDSYRGALQERAQVQADNQANHYVPGTPQYEENQRKLSQIDTRLHGMLMGLGLRAQSVNQGQQRIDLDTDKTYNPEPTAQERTKGDLAQSAVNQINVMRDVVNRRKDLFGPAAGSGTQFQTWLGSEDPDAARYNAAQTYLAEHSAGVFGGRGAYILQGLHNLSNQRQNPDALNSFLDESQQTAQHFVNAGTTHAKGERGAAAGGTPKPAGSNAVEYQPQPNEKRVYELPNQKGKVIGYTVDGKTFSHKL